MHTKRRLYLRTCLCPCTVVCNKVHLPLTLGRLFFDVKYFKSHHDVELHKCKVFSTPFPP